MSSLRDLDHREVAAAAAAALARAWSDNLRIEAVEPLGEPERRNLILRGKAIGNGDERAVIIKATRSAGYDPRSETAFRESGLVREWAAAALLAARSARHGAALLAGDAERGILVFEDLGAGIGSLVQPLLGGGAEGAERTLTAYATALGCLHADTTGCAEDHARALRAGFPAVRRAPPDHHGRLRGVGAKLAERLGVAPADEDLRQIAEPLEHPGPWLALVHGDPCPDNTLLVGDNLVLIDFEYAQPGHALLDAAYWQMGFPTCWCAGRIPDAVAERMTATYRREAGRTIAPALDDDAFARESALMSAAWLLDCLDWRLDSALAEDGRWGTASIRSRLLRYLEATIAVTKNAGALPGLQAVACAWLDTLRKRWPSTAPLEPYPAFVAQAD